MVVFHSHGFQPELCRLPLALDVNMNRLTSIAGKEEEPVGTPLQNGWTHSAIVTVLSQPAKPDSIRLTSAFCRDDLIIAPLGVGCKRRLAGSSFLVKPDFALMTRMDLPMRA